MNNFFLQVKHIVRLIYLFFTRIKSIINFVQIIELEEKSKNESLDVFNEFEFLKHLIGRIAPNLLLIVDIAASDGITQSPVFSFFKNGSKGVAFEVDAIKFFKLAYFYRDFENVTLLRKKVTPKNIIELLHSNEIDLNFDILNMDIDSYDLDVVIELLKSDYKPKIISLEINEKIPNGIYFKVNFNPTWKWDVSHFYGCSLDAATLELSMYNYRLVKLIYNNAFFLHNSFKEFEFPKISSSEAYEIGYLNADNVENLFESNRNVRYWNNLDKSDAILEINKFFAKYKDLYTIYLL